MKSTRYASLLIALLFGFTAKAQVYTPVSLVNPTLVSAPNGGLKPGAIWKYSNAAGGNGNFIDAYIEVVKTNNTGSDAVGLFALDQPASVNNPGGYDTAFQPVTSCSNINSSGLWTPSQGCGTANVQISYSTNQDYLVYFRLYFKKAGTQVDTALNVQASFIDIDGFGGGSEAEQNGFMPGNSYAVAPGTTLSFRRRADGLIVAEGQPANLAGVTLTATTAITQVNYLNRTSITFGMGMHTHDANASGNCYDKIAGGRLASLSFYGQPTGLTVVTNTNFSISGNVWDDADGSAGGTFTNIRTNSEPGTNGGTMYVYALDSATGTVLKRTTVNANGTWTISGLAENYPVRILLSSAAIAEGVTNGAPSIGTVNAGWVATSPLARPVFRPVANVTGIDFGVEQIPVGNNFTAPSQLNPGGTTTVIVPSAAFTGTDAEDGTYVTGLSGKKVTLTPGVNGDLYYLGAKITTTTTYSSFDPTKLTIDPTGPNPTSQVAVTPTFTYSVYDAANQPSVPKTITMPFEPPIIISGNVWDDVSGDAVKNGTEPFTNAGGLNAVLTDAGGNVMQVIAVNPTTGAYQFDKSISNTTYKVVLTTSTPSIGSSLTSSSLPNGVNGPWLSTGVNLNGTANTGNTTGIITITTGTVNVTNQNFGIEQRPAAGAGTNNLGTNPGGTVQVSFPSNTFTNTTASSDPTPGAVTAIRITSFPTNATSIVINGTSYTSATFPAGGVTVPTNASGNPTQTITVDPSFPGSGSVSIPFVAVDAAGKESTNTGTAVGNFTTALAGNVFNDVNGLSDNTVNGTGTNAGGLNAILVNASGNVVATTTVSAGGAYSFTGLTDGTYSVRITTNSGTIGQPAPAVALPSGWVSTGENNGTAAGNDGTVNSILTPIALSAPITQANFGIQQPPTAGGGTNNFGTTPGGTAQVGFPSNTFTNTALSSDLSPGTVTAIRITGYPTNATSIVINGTSYTSATFPAGGVTVPTDASGNPTQTITVDPSFNGSGTVTIPFVAVDAAGAESSNTGTAVGNFTTALAGNVFNDVNGLSDNTVNGIATNVGGTLNAVLININTGLVVNSTPVNAGGNYSFTGLLDGNYSVLLTTNTAAIGSVPPAAALPAGWVYTGENNGTAAGNDGTVNGTLTPIALSAPITQANFGIEQPPTAGAGTNNFGTNPGGTVQVTFPANTFTNTTSSSDPTPGAVTAIRITSFPNNATSIVINGTTYTAGTFPAGGVTVPTNASGSPTQTITVDPSFLGSGSVSIPFVAVDAAGKESTNTGTAVGNFTTALAGNVFNDANGLTDNTVNGTGTNAGGLNAILVNASGNVVATTTVSAGGAYSFTGLTDGTYSVRITTNTGTIGQPAPAVTLPSGWVSTGENNGTAAGNDGTVNSILTPLVLSAPITQANFGIERIPVGSNYTAASQLNPGGTITVPVPAAAFTGTDSEDGTYTTGLSGKKVTLTPGTNADIYYNGTKLTGALTISGFNPALVTLDPTGPNPTSQVAVTSSFSYSVFDAADLPSLPKTISLPFEPPIIISGNVWDDANGDAIKNGTEPFTNAGALNAVLTDASGNVLQVSAVNATTGAYQFDKSISNTTYKVLLTTTNPAVGSLFNSSSLPPAANTWVNTGVNLNGVPNTGNLTGIITVTTTTVNLSNQNFGIEQIPAGNNYTAASQLNPGGALTVPVPAALSGSDPEDGTYPVGLTAKKVTINAAANGDLYYNGSKITGPLTINVFDPSKLYIDPTGPTPTTQVFVTATFTYSVFDAADQPSAPKTIIMPFEPPIIISGNVWDDANADATKNGVEPFTNAGGLNAVLTDASGSILQVVAVNPTTGFYQFDKSISNTTYKVILTTTNPAVGGSLSTSSLPNGTYGPWVNTGVNLNGVPNAVNKSGIITLTTVASNLTNQNFGIQQPPTGNNYTAASQFNPGGTATVPVPLAAFTGNDPEDGTYAAGLSGKKVTINPGTNGDLYYNGTKITMSTTYTNFDPTKLQIDPTGPNPTGYVAVTSTFTYSVYDAGDLPSVAKTITMPFDAALCIKTRVYLEGALMNNGNATAADGRPLMRDDLRNSPFTGLNYIPVQDPYEFPTDYVDVTAQYNKVVTQNSNYPAFQSVTDSATVFGVSGQQAIVDWVFVELRSKSNNASVIATRAALLQRDGDVVETDGVGCVLFPTIPIDSYYVSIRHRSHLGTMTQFAQAPTQLQTLVDFTVPTTPLYDKGVQGPFDFTGLSQKENAVGTYRAMWQGDFNADGKVKYDNPDDDLSVMLFDVISHPNNTTLASNYDFGYGYRQGDYDMNSKTKFDNPDDDNASELFQAILYPLNTEFASNFDFMIQQLP